MNKNTWPEYRMRAECARLLRAQQRSTEPLPQRPLSEHEIPEQGEN